MRVAIYALLFSTLAAAQSVPRLEQLRLPETTGPSILTIVQIDGKWQIKALKIGSNVAVDLTAGTINAKETNQAVHFITEIYKLTQPDDGFNLTDIPYEPTLATLHVYLNGVMLAEGEDYQVDGPNKLVRILPEKHVTKAGDIVQIKYLRKF